MDKLGRWIDRYWPFALICLILCVEVEILVDSGLVPDFIIPKPSQVWHNLVDQGPVLLDHAKLTLAEVGLGLVFSIGLGILIGVLLYYSRFMERAFYPFVLISQTIPTIALSPIFVLWFGYEIWTKVAIIFLITFFPIVVAVFDGLKRTDSEYLELFRVMEASRWQRFYYLQWPMALPGIYSGIKLAVIYSLIGAVIGEWLGGNAGLGYYIRRMSSSIKAEGVFAGIIALSVMGIVLFNLVTLLENHSLKYLNQERRKDR
ncbi:ABC transporter permease [Ignavigranum ruoffiae]|uniref:Putative hydroxymethylpyrimidine transport system permease protein n=1 Tax=Ignavigranum ruoffiae TaxID=89093 RepID=A0A1H9GLA5_9LACT|nr:ABC transporter permease [Ignavigranum ruoffiae]SEQ50829.1 putative hydroxymethylpyrimidine transport system permease protein [Ignavigranum ruoffiae]